MLVYVAKANFNILVTKRLRRGTPSGKSMFITFQLHITVWGIIDKLILTAYTYSILSKEALSLELVADVILISPFSSSNFSKNSLNFSSISTNPKSDDSFLFLLIRFYVNVNATEIQYLLSKSSEFSDFWVPSIAMSFTKRSL